MWLQATRCQPAGTAFAAWRETVEPMLDREPSQSLLAAAAGESVALDRAEVVSNAAVLMLGGIETTEGMFANAILHLLSRPAALQEVRRDPSLLANAVEESLRLEPAAAVIDRYATCDVSLADASIQRRELVTISLAGANRDPETFPDPDRFDIGRGNAPSTLRSPRGPTSASECTSPVSKPTPRSRGYWSSYPGCSTRRSPRHRGASYPQAARVRVLLD